MKKDRKLTLDDFDNYYTMKFRPAKIKLIINQRKSALVLLASGDKEYMAELEGTDDIEASTVCHMESFGPLGVLGINMDRFKLKRSFLLGKVRDNEEILVPLTQIK